MAFGAKLGFVTGAIATGTLKGAFMGALTGAAFGAVGSYFPGTSAFSLEGFLSFGFVGGVTSVLQGGKFGHGFFSAGAGVLAGGAKWIQNAKLAVRVLAKTIIGGTISSLTGGKFANGAVTGAFTAVVSELAVTASERGSSEVEYYGDDENGAEYSYEDRIKLGEALKTQGGELTTILNKAKTGDPDAIAKVKEWFGNKADYDQLLERGAVLSDKASSFQSYKFRKLGTENRLADGNTRAYACVICSGTNKGTIYLSKTAFGDVMSGNLGRYTLIHEAAHLAFGFHHGSSETPYLDVRHGNDNYGEIYAYQGLLRSQ